MNDFPVMGEIDGTKVVIMQRHAYDSMKADAEDYRTLADCVGEKLADELDDDDIAEVSILCKVVEDAAGVLGSRGEHFIRFEGPKFSISHSWRCKVENKDRLFDCEYHAALDGWDEWPGDGLYRMELTSGGALALEPVES